MGKYFTDLAKQAGFDEEYIKLYQQENSVIPAPTPNQTQSNQPVTGKNPDIVPMMPGESAELTQDFDTYNPGMGYYDDLHKGIDIGAKEGQQVTNPIGGTVLSSTYDPTYGYNTVIIPENPQQAMQRSGNPLSGDFSGYSPEEEAVRMSHFQSPVPYNPGDYMATGSAQLTAGSTGSTTGPHIDIESFRTGNQGNYGKYSSFLEKHPEFKTFLLNAR